jgi:MtN3 and saliva related transmembrane protein
MISFTEVIGLVAGFLISIGLVPQILRILKLRDARQISLPFNLLSLGGTALWLAYGISLGLLAVTFWNGVNCILYVVLLLVKLRYGMRRGLSTNGGVSQPGPAAAMTHSGSFEKRG